MNLDEYRIMYEVEDTHWWYRGLRKIISQSVVRNFKSDNLRILDLGCGTGRTLSLLDSFGTVTGVDISGEAIQFSQKRGHENLLVGSASSLPFDSNQFDLVCMMDVLYHKAVPDKSVPLEEAYRVLKQGGILLINVPAYQWLRSSHDDAIHTDKRFTNGELHDLLTEAKFSVEKITFWNTVLFPLIVLIRVLRRNRAGSGSDLENYRPGIASAFLFGILKAESYILRFVSFPFGLSIFSIGKKTT